MSTPATRLVCAGCGAEPDRADLLQLACPNADTGDDVDHVLRRVLEPDGVRFPLDDPEPNPFLRYRRLLHPYHVARHGGMDDRELCALVRALDEAVADVDGHGFRVTPFARSGELSDRLGFSSAGGVWVKDETRNVAGSHKARHLFDVLIALEVADALGGGGATRKRELAIASCGNAALAAAVLAAAARRVLRVFVPADADPVVLDRLEELGAHVAVSWRSGEVAGDPTYHRLRLAVAEGAIPFTCQGNLDGLAVEGGQTLGYELVSDLAAAGVTLDRLVVQVGGGALASACVASFRDAVRLGALTSPPRVDTVQTAGAWPLKRAFDAVAARAGDEGPAAAVRYAAGHRSEFMWPWEQEPRSIAHGILDDETYDWLAVVEGMLDTGGTALAVGDDALARANALARRTTRIPVDPTGSAGLAGLIALRDAGEVGDDERVAVLFTGVDRTAPPTRRNRHEELPGQRHPVAEGLRAS